MSEQEKIIKKGNNDNIISMKVQYQRKIKDLQKKHKEELRTKLKEIIQQTQGLQLQVNLLQEKNDELQLLIKEKQQKIEELSNKILQRNNKEQSLINDYNQKINQQVNKINNLKDDYQNKITNINSNNQQMINKLKDQLQETRVKLSQSVLSCQDLTEKYNQLSGKINSQEIKIQKMKAEGYQVAMALIIEKQNMQEIKQQQKDVIDKLKNIQNIQDDQILKIKAKGFDLSQQLQQVINRHNQIYTSLLSIFQEIRKNQAINKMQFNEIQQN